MAENDCNAMWASMMNNSNQWINNPWIYFVFLALFGRNGGLFGNGGGVADASLAQQMQDNHNSDLLMGAIKGNADAARSLASNLNCDANALNATLNAMRNASDLGFANMASTFQNCCCNNRMDTQKMGYENQISNLQQTNALTGRIDQLANGVQQGFASIGFETQAQTCALQKSICDGNQRIIDTMNNHWNQDLRDRLFEMSQTAQTASIVSQLKTTA